MSDSHLENQLNKETQRELEELAEFGTRRLTGAHAYLVAAVAGIWSIFQISLQAGLLLSSEYVRCFHLAFAITLVYLSFPALKNKSLRNYKDDSTESPKRFGFLRVSDKIHWTDLLCAALAFVGAIYLVLDYEGIAGRQGAPLFRDL